MTEPTNPQDPQQVPGQPPAFNPEPQAPQFPASGAPVAPGVGHQAAQGFPAAPDYGSPYGAPTAPPTRPNLVLAAAVLFWVGAVAWVAAGIMYLSMKDSIVATGLSQVSTQQSQNLTPEQIESVLSTTVTIMASLGFVGAVLFAVVGLLLWFGLGWGRILGIIFVAASLFFGFVLAPLGVVALLAGIVAVVLSFLKPSSEFFRNNKAFKQFAGAR